MIFETVEEMKKKRKKRGSFFTGEAEKSSNREVMVDLKLLCVVLITTS